MPIPRASLLALVLLTGCAPAPAPEPREPGPIAAPATASAPVPPRQTSLGRYYVAYTAAVPIQTNELVTLTVRVFRDAALRQPAAGVALWADAAMPAHHHGLSLTPRTTPIPGAPGAFRVEGLLFHMPGAWELYFDVRENGQEDRAKFDLAL